MTRFQPRYAAYAAAHDLSPDEMLRRDHDEWPGGVMTGFTLWIRERWDEWAQRRGGMPQVKSEEHHRDFDAWLNEKTGVDLPRGRP